MSQSHGRVLIVDDEIAIRRALHNTLHGLGFEVDDAASGEAALDRVGEAEYDVVLMDINMPGIGGIRACREIRKSLPHLGILMLTVRDREEDKVTALDAGADDYITKPFELREILARIRTVMRRAGLRTAPATSVSGSASGENVSDVLVFEGWRLDLLRRELRRLNGELVPLTAGEFELLCVFVRHPNRVLNRDQVIDLVKGREWAAYDRGVDTQVMRLRKKVETDPSNPSLIKTVRGAGYVFAAAVTAG